MNKQQKKLNTHKPQFDLNVHVRDGKGNIVKENHYRLTIKDGVKEFERPPGSGQFFDEAGNKTRYVKPKVNAKDIAANQVQMEEVLKELEALKLKNAELEAKWKEENPDEEEEIHMTANDVTVDDIPTIPASKTDNSEEMRLMQAAGASLKGLAVQNPKPQFKR